ncbi:hypothetical protein TTRE_0000105301 [Trichuris trichiura]|uniref:Uncharacterized protein n=1 Tax=Trichuris trichiura TaxID=36087 RepID=A0A077YYC0_TRITR|nr:hypothetical protein TTRE_0000105301 [Trichuris trichiura]
MVSLKQELQVLDYFGAICVFISFFVIVLIVSVTCILWFCVSENDDMTVFAKVFSFENRFQKFKFAMFVVFQWNLGRRKRSYDVKTEQRPLNR